MSTEKISELEKEIESKIEELRQLAMASGKDAGFSVKWKTYSVYLPENEDEDMNEYMQEEHGCERGDWISSSERC